MNTSDKIIELYKEGNNVSEIADVLRMPVTDVGKVLNENKGKLVEEKEESKGRFEVDKSIKTTETLKDLHEKTLKIVDAAMDRHDYNLALQAIKEAKEQTRITMQKKKEFDRGMKDDLIPKTFGEHLTIHMKKRGLIKDEGENKTLDNIQD